MSLNDVEVSGPVQVTGTTGWTKITGSALRGPVRVHGSSGTVAPDLSATSVRGTLQCTGNATAPKLTGTQVSRGRQGTAPGSSSVIRRPLGAAGTWDRFLWIPGQAAP